MKMLKLKDEKKLSRDVSDFHYSKNIICYKWHDNRPVLLLAINVDSMSAAYNVMRRTKCSATKAFDSCPNIIKLLNNAQWHKCAYDGSKTAAYRLDCKNKYRFYLSMLFDVMGVALVKSQIICTKHGNDISSLNHNILAAKPLIGRYNNCKRSFPSSRPSKQKSYEPSMSREVPTHMPKF